LLKQNKNKIDVYYNYNIILNNINSTAFDINIKTNTINISINRFKALSFQRKGGGKKEKNPQDIQCKILKSFYDLLNELTYKNTVNLNELSFKVF